MFIAKVLVSYLKRMDGAISPEGFFFTLIISPKRTRPRIPFRYIKSHISRIIYLKRYIENSCVKAQ